MMGNQWQFWGVQMADLPNESGSSWGIERQVWVVETADLASLSDNHCELLIQAMAGFEQQGMGRNGDVILARGTLSVSL
jgi:hypothetical protein